MITCRVGVVLSYDKKKFLKKSILIIDILLTINAFCISYFIRNWYFSKEHGQIAKFNNYIWILAIATLCIIIFMALLKSYSQILEDKFYISSFKVAISILLSLLLMFSIFFVLGEKSLSRLFFGIFSCIELLMIVLERAILKISLYYYYKDKVHRKNVLIVGCGKLGKEYFEEINKNEQIGINFVGFLDTGKHDKIEVDKQAIIGRIEDLKIIAKENSIDDVIFAVTIEYYANIQPYVLKCETMGITVHMAMDLFNLTISKTRVGGVGTLPVVTFYSGSNNHAQLLAKRILDIFGGLVGMVLASLAFIIIGPLIYLESPGNVLFSQNRVGKNGRIFKCYKFRSMCMDAEERKKELMSENEMNGAMFKIKDDPRITRIGKFIRATSIDELPQFFNVLMGDMSLVGTRPPTEDEVEEYDDWHWRRLSVKPGITGLWQVSGRNNISDFGDVVKLDTEYIDNWSIWLDIKLILMTVKVVFARAGAS